jgi:hypothetical protein
MKMNRFYYKFSFVLTAFCLCISISLKAQNASFTPNHLKAAEDMLAAMEMPSLMTNSINSVVKAQTANMPTDKQEVFAEVMKTFLNKYLSWDSIKTDMAKIYATEFTEAEIKELSQFYQTPLGKKIVTKSPALMQKGMALGQQRVAAHQTELVEMFKAASPQK